jgi:hypothetical protein
LSTLAVAILVYIDTITSRRNHTTTADKLSRAGFVLAAYACVLALVFSLGLTVGDFLPAALDHIDVCRKAHHLRVHNDPPQPLPPLSQEERRNLKEIEKWTEYNLWLARKCLDVGVNTILVSSLILCWAEFGLEASILVTMGLVIVLLTSLYKGYRLRLRFNAMWRDYPTQDKERRRGLFWRVWQVEA